MNFHLMDGNFMLWRAWSTSGQTSSRPRERIPLQLLDWFCSYSLTLRCGGGALAFDGNENFRYDIFANYKANRSGSGGTSDAEVKHGPLKGMTVSDAVYSCLPPTVDLFRSVGIAVIQEPKYEADDVLNSGAKKLGIKGNHVYLSCRDKDMVQCVNSQVTLHIPEMQGKSAVLYTPESTPTLKKGLTPLQFLDYQILMGDPMDTVPAVPGITEAKAMGILREYGSLKAFFKTEVGRKFYDLRATELHRNKDLVGLSKKAFPLKGSDISFRHLHGSASSKAFTNLRDAQTKSSLF